MFRGGGSGQAGAGAMPLVRDVEGGQQKYQTQMSTTVRAVESCSINCMRSVLDYHVEFPSLSDSYLVKVRLPTCDLHV